MKKISLSVLSSILILSAVVIAGCSSAVLQTEGQIEPSSKRAAVLVQYNFKTSDEAHDIILIDEKMKNYRIKIPKNTNTARGVVVHLPIKKQYALASISQARPTGGRKEYMLAKELTLFKVKRNHVNRLPYFEITMDESKDTYTIQGEKPGENKKHKSFARTQFDSELPVNEVFVEELKAL